MKLRYLLVIPVFLFNQTSFADINDIIQYLEKIQGYDSSLPDIESLTKDLKNAMTGTNNWGSYNLKDYQSYGSGAANWSDVLNMAKGGGGSGALGQTMSQISNQFPANQNLINQVVSDPTTQNYYAAQSQTVLANRSASQLDFDNIQKQIDQQSELRSNVGKTQDLKSSVDLLSRTQIESNMINLQVLRQIAAGNQQKSLDSQGELNDAVLNAHFLQKTQP